MGGTTSSFAYRCVRQHSEQGLDRRVAKVDEITRTPLIRKKLDHIEVEAEPAAHHTSTRAVVVGWV
jgi:hypothetical protein